MQTAVVLQYAQYNILYCTICTHSSRRQCGCYHSAQRTTQQGALARSVLQREGCQTRSGEKPACLPVSEESSKRKLRYYIVSTLSAVWRGCSHCLEGSTLYYCILHKKKKKGFSFIRYFLSATRKKKGTSFSIFIALQNDRRASLTRLQHLS